MIRATQINRFLGGRGFNVVAAILLLVAAICSHAAGGIVPAATGDSGFCFPSANLWLAPGFWPMMLNVLCIVATGYAITYLNRLHGFIRADASMAMSAFLLLMLATPAASTYFFDGTAMLMVVVASAFLIFFTYHERHSQRNVFLAFALLSFYSMMQLSVIWLVPVYCLGFVQMRIMRLRSFIAMLLGLLTPYWITWGLGITPLDAFAAPPMGGVWELSSPQWVLVITSAVTMVALMVMMAMNMMRIISYNAKRRACNGFFTILAITIMVLHIFDYSHCATYLPTLNLCLAIHIGHAFTGSTAERRYIPILVFALLCIALHAYNLYFA